MSDFYWSTHKAPRPPVSATASLQRHKNAAWMFAMVGPLAIGLDATLRPADSHRPRFTVDWLWRSKASLRLEL